MIPSFRVACWALPASGRLTHHIMHALAQHSGIALLNGDPAHLVPEPIDEGLAAAVLQVPRETQARKVPQVREVLQFGTH